MNKSLLQTTFREWQTHFARPLTHIIVLGVSVILAVIGPFGTIDILRAFPRFGFWLVQVYVTYSVGFTVSALCRSAFRDRVPQWISIGLEALINALAILCVVLGIIYLVFGPVLELNEFLAFSLNILLISIVITLILHAIGKHYVEVPTAEGVPLLDRLPIEKRGPLVSISVEDHYVRVRTSKGEEIILLRLSDAVKETGATQGLQVHRSHWVAIDQVTSVRRDDARAILTMRHGPEIPVSRANIAAAKEAGLTPR